MLIFTNADTPQI